MKGIGGRVTLLNWGKPMDLGSTLSLEKLSEQTFQTCETKEGTRPDSEIGCRWVGSYRLVTSNAW